MKKKGSALLTVIILVGLLMAIGMVTMTRTTSSMKVNKVYEKEIDDVKLSLESGVEIGYSWLKKYVADNKYNGEIGLIKDDFTLDFINDKNIKIKITSDNQNFYIESTNNLKNMKAKVKKVISTTEKTIPSQKITLDKPIALMVPYNKNIVYMDGTVEKPINVKGVHPIYDFSSILNYSDNSKVYNISKSNWGTDVAPSIVNTYSGGTAMQVQFVEHSISPYKYIKLVSTTPSYNVSGNVNIENNWDNYKDKNTGNVKIVSSGIVNINLTSDVNLNNATICAEEIIIDGYRKFNINNSNLKAKKIYIRGSDNRIFVNCNIESNLFDLNGSSIRTLDNTKIDSDVIIISGSGDRMIKNNSSFNSIKMTVDCTNPASFDNININAETLDIKGSCDRSFTNSTIKSNNFSIVATNNTSFKNVNVISGTFDISGSCSRVFENTKIVSNSLKIDSTNVVEFKDSKLYTNILDIKGSVDRNFNNSSIVSNKIVIETTNNINFNNCLAISEKLIYKANHIGVLPITDINKLNSYFSEAQDYIIINGGTEKVVEMGYGMEKIQYEVN
jgi:hypothetical protein